ncbi:hypothetical protein [Nakamurella sp.]|uniref:hypothetical protein n=1 Tax=Nakamurella sp. TaxID=1869182 RepID=UPI003B3AAD20
MATMITSPCSGERNGNGLSPEGCSAERLTRHLRITRDLLSCCVADSTISNHTPLAKPSMLALGDAPPVGVAEVRMFCGHLL